MDCEYPKNECSMHSYLIYMNIYIYIDQYIF